MFDIKEYYEAESVENAIELRLSHPEADIIAGGSDVLVQMRNGKRAGHELISIYLLDELRGIQMDEDGTIRIGSLSSFSDLESDPVLKKYVPVLGEAAGTAGGPQIRNIGTIGGNTCNGVTSADTSSTLHAYEAVIELKGPDGIRKVPIHDFYLGPGKVDIRAGEIETAVLIPRESWEDTQGCYYKYAMRNAMDIATSGCSVNVRLTPDKMYIDRLRIAFGVAAPVPIRAPHAEIAAKNKPVSRELVDEVALAVLEDIRPRDSWRASKTLRQHIDVEMARRCTKEAIRRCGGEI